MKQTKKLQIFYSPNYIPFNFDASAPIISVFSFSIIQFWKFYAIYLRHFKFKFFQYLIIINLQIPKIKKPMNFTQNHILCLVHSTFLVSFFIIRTQYIIFYYFLCKNIIKLMETDSSKHKTKIGRWSKEEHRIFLLGLSEYGKQ